MAIRHRPLQQAWRIPERFVANRYHLSAHGCGMTGECPYRYHAMDFDGSSDDGALEPGMTLCVESSIGKQGGLEGVKLEQQLHAQVEVAGAGAVIPQLTRRAVKNGVDANLATLKRVLEDRASAPERARGNGSALYIPQSRTSCP